MRPYWPDRSVYFLTGATFLHYPYFREPGQKQILLRQFAKIQKKFEISISAFSIAINHYHIKFFLEKGLDLSKIRQILHGGTSYEYRKRYDTKFKEMWQDSRVIKVISENMDWKITGYIIGNLLKHKEINNFEDLKNNPFLSYRYTAEKYGDETARQLVYGVIDVAEDGDRVFDLEKLKKTKVSKPSAKAG